MLNLKYIKLNINLLYIYIYIYIYPLINNNLKFSYPTLIHTQPKPTHIIHKPFTEPRFWNQDFPPQINLNIH